MKKGRLFKKNLLITSLKNDRIIHMTEYFDEDESQNIEQRRDFYTKKSNYNYFFFS